MLPYLLSENRAGINLACTPTIPDGSEISSLSLLIESINKLIRPENLKTFVNTQDLSLLTACPVVNNRNWMITRLAASTRNTETMPLLVALMAKELAKFNIRVNAIGPTYTKTRLVKSLNEDPEKLKFIIERTPLRRLAEVSEMAGGILFLASNASSMVTGHTLMIDGGWASN